MEMQILMSLLLFTAVLVRGPPSVPKQVAVAYDAELDATAVRSDSASIHVSVKVKSFNIEVFNFDGKRNDIFEEEEMERRKKVTEERRRVLNAEAEYRLKQIGQSIKAGYPDVISLQEDLEPSPLTADHIPGYRKVGSCQGELLTWEVIQNLFDTPDHTYLANSIWVSTEFLKSHPLSEFHDFQWLVKGLPPRCFAIADFGAFSVASVHLNGGKFDDEFFLDVGNIEDRKRVKESKNNALQGLIRKHYPTIIVGDFNGEPSSAQCLTRLQGYPAGSSGDAKKDFEYFYSSGHPLLKEKGYKAAYDNSIGATSKYGGTVDWIYYDSKQISEVKADSAVGSTLDKSDHNAVMVEFEFGEICPAKGAELPDAASGKRREPILGERRKEARLIV